MRCLLQILLLPMMLLLILDSVDTLFIGKFIGLLPANYSLLSLLKQLLFELSGFGKLVLFLAVNVSFEDSQDLNVAKRGIRVIKLGKWSRYL